jgi:hypothetical protein
MQALGSRIGTRALTPDYNHTWAKERQALSGAYRKGIAFHGIKYLYFQSTTWRAKHS